VTSNSELHSAQITFISVPPCGFYESVQIGQQVDIQAEQIKPTLKLM
jgi:hypothetical protein